MMDRITPYNDKHGTDTRVDEIVMTGADIHFEMLTNATAFLSITKHGVEQLFCISVEKRSLVLRMTETINKEE